MSKATNDPSRFTSQDATMTATATTVTTTVTTVTTTNNNAVNNHDNRNLNGIGTNMPANVDRKSLIVKSLLLKAAALKQEGNNLFSIDDNYTAAHESYNQAIRILQQILVHFTNDDDNDNHVGSDDYEEQKAAHGHGHEHGETAKADTNATSTPTATPTAQRQEAIRLYINLIGNNSLVLYKLTRYADSLSYCNCIIRDNVNHDASASASASTHTNTNTNTGGTTESAHEHNAINHSHSENHNLQLNLTPDNTDYDLTKIYYRRGLAKEALGQHHPAKIDLQTCIDLFNNNNNNSSTDSTNTKQLKQQQDAKNILVRIEARIHTQEQLQQIQSCSKSMAKCPTPDQQRNIISALLLQSNHPRMGESFYIIDFNWWTRWCHHVDFASMPKHLLDSLFYIIPENQNEKNNQQQNQQQEKMDVDVDLQDGKIQSHSDDNDDNSSSEEEDSDDDDDSYHQGYGALPGVLNNSKLILSPLFDNDFENNRSHATELMRQEWSWRARRTCSSSSSSFNEHALVSNDINIDIVLKPQLVRGYHYEILPREAYVALKLWYGESSPSIIKRAMMLQTDEQTTSNGTRATNAQPTDTGANATTITSRISIVLYDIDDLTGFSAASKRQALHQQYDPNSGRAGLNNLGNTCFMNSALQCLSHATPLTRYFLTNEYKLDINTNNPIGTGGKLAAAYETMIRALWTAKKRQTSVYPRALKRAIALFAPRFAGTSQQDSQEFLAFLLDGLHEDLNRIKNPPYIEKADVTHEHDLNVAAADAWDSHCKRNQSIVMDTFYGQFKSTCVCPNCKKISVSFDAFNHVSLEIPQLSSLGKRIVPIILFQANLPSEQPMRYGISVPKHATLGDVKLQLSSLSQIPASRLAICDIYQSSIYEIIRDEKSISALNSDDVVVAYEVDPFTPSTMHVIAGHVRSSGATGKSSIGYPLFTSFSTDFSCRQVIQHFHNRLAYLAPEGTSFEVRLAESSGQPIQAFPDPLSESLSAVIPDNDAKFTSFLKDDCSESFLFVTIDWNANDLTAFANFNAFLDHPSLNEAVEKHRAAPNRSLTLDQCLENFTQPERLDEDNKWYCSTCKDHVRAEKTMTLWRLPNILVIHLKRFEFRNALRREKLDTHVDYQLEGLDMNKYCASSKDENAFVVDGVPATYDLFGVVNHYGRMGFGHYTAYARRWNEHIMEDDWKLFDDSIVRDDVTKADVVSNAGYLLFYRRRDFA